MALEYSEIKQVVVDDLIEHHNYTEKKANDLADSVTDKVINKMWDAFSDELSYQVERNS